MTKKIDPLRIHQLELLLKWEGQIGNARLRELFGFKSVRASQWLKEFKDFRPHWTEWVSATKTLNATYQFYTDIKKDNSFSLSEYLTLVGAPSTTHNENQNVVALGFPEITSPNPRFFGILSIAARLGREVEITYSSMGEPTPHTRIIAPHSIVKAGPRWHIRAYSQHNKQFRDYTLGRISNVKLLKETSQFSLKDDKDWLTEVKIRLVAHPELSVDQSNVIRLEYFANTSARVTICRGPLINYFIKDIGAAINLEKQKPPEYFLAVENVKEISPWLFSK